MLVPGAIEHKTNPIYEILARYMDAYLAEVIAEEIKKAINGH